MCGLHRTVFSHDPGPCRSLKGVVGGSEDIVTLPSGLVFISSVSTFVFSHRQTRRLWSTTEILRFRGSMVYFLLDVLINNNFCMLCFGLPKKMLCFSFPRAMHSTPLTEEGFTLGDMAAPRNQKKWGFLKTLTNTGFTHMDLVCGRIQTLVSVSLIWNQDMIVFGVLTQGLFSLWFILAIGLPFVPVCGGHEMFSFHLQKTLCSFAWTITPWAIALKNLFTIKKPTCWITLSALWTQQ